jgi:hypothetical protein
MYHSPTTRLRVISWVITFLLPLAAWSAARYSLPFFHPGVGVFFIAAACISAVIAGLPAALVGALLNTAALNGFAYLYQPETSASSNELWSALLIAVALVVGWRGRSGPRQMAAGRLSATLPGCAMSLTPAQRSRATTSASSSSNLSCTAC